MSFLLVCNEDPVNLDGYLDGSGNFQVKHVTDNLVDYDQEIHMEHDTSTSITMKVFDFVDGSDTWEISGEHPGESGTISWSRGSDHCYYTFTEPASSPIDVDLTATSGSSRKSLQIKSKPDPVGA